MGSPLASRQSSSYGSFLVKVCGFRLWPVVGGGFELVRRVEMTSTLVTDSYPWVLGTAPLQLFAQGRVDTEHGGSAPS